jgi:hypothetical protein
VLHFAPIPRLTANTADLKETGEKGDALMAMKFPSDEWGKAFAEQLNASDDYERSAKDWEGDFIFIIEPDKSYPEEAYMFVGLYHGKCTDTAMLANENEREAQFIIRAPYGNWRKVIAAKEMVNCVSRVPTDWPD